MKEIFKKISYHISLKCKIVRRVGNKEKKGGFAYKNVEKGNLNLPFPHHKRLIMRI